MNEVTLAKKRCKLKILDVLKIAVVDFCCKTRTFLQFLGAGYKCSGPCESGHRCSPNCKESAKEVEEVHDDCHYFAPAYCNHRRTLNFATMEEVINRGK